MNETTQCPCGSAKTFGACCQPFLLGTAVPPTAEALMRARYSAYVTADIDFVEKTTHSKTKAGFDRASSQKWAEQSQWQGLEIMKVIQGQEEDTEGTVEFVATYTQDNEEIKHHEISTFRRENGAWTFVDGRISHQPFRHEQPKIGRNDPCPCGSGKKYKKCCGQK